MKKVEKIFIYSNNKLYLTLVNSYEGIPLIVYEKEIDQFRISDLKKSSYFEGVKSKIAQVEAEVNKNFASIIENNLPKLMLTSEYLEIRREQFTKEFEQKYEVNKDDIQRIIQKGIDDIAEVLPDNQQVTEYNIISHILDNQQVESIYGKKVNDIKLIADILITDKSTINELNSLFKSVNIIFDRKYLIDYRILKRLKKEDTVIIDLNYEFNKTFIKDKNTLFINYLNTGTGTILTKLYEFFKEEYDEEKAEKITRFVKKNWILSTFDYEYDIIEGVELKKIVNVTREIYLQYFNLLFSKLNKFEKFYIIADDMFEKEFVKFLNLNFDLEIKSAFPNNIIISSVLSNKVGYCLNKIYEEEV